MSIPPSPKSVLALVIVGALVLAGGALYLSVAVGDVLSLLLPQVLTLQVMVSFAALFAAAWAARWLTVGTLPRLQPSFAMTMWGGFRVALLIAFAVLVLGWLAALALGLAVQNALLRGMIMLAVVSFLTGCVGGAYLNSVLAIRHWRGQTLE